MDNESNIPPVNKETIPDFKEERLKKEKRERTKNGEEIKKDAIDPNNYASYRIKEIYPTDYIVQNSLPGKYKKKKHEILPEGAFTIIALFIYFGYLALSYCNSRFGKQYAWLSALIVFMPAYVSLLYLCLFRYRQEIVENLRACSIVEFLDNNENVKIREKQTEREYIIKNAGYKKDSIIIAFDVKKNKDCFITQYCLLNTEHTSGITIENLMF